ncbi:MAG: PEP-CTERM sorting domain-containing protein [Cyanobacteria bacterium J06635_10]
MSISLLKKATFFTLSAISISSIIAVKPSYAADITIPIPVDAGTPGFDYTDGGEGTPGDTNDDFNGFFTEDFGFLNSGGSATSGNSPFLSDEFIQNQLKEVILSFDFYNASDAQLQLTVNQSGSSVFSQFLTDIGDAGENFSLDITNLFKDNGAGNYTITYELLGGNPPSLAGFNNVALSIATVPEPSLVAGFLALGIGAAIKRKRKG